jgi:hypothetical protein
MSDTSAEVLETRRQAQEMRDKLCKELADARFGRDATAWVDLNKQFINNHRLPWERRRRHK